jgi:hypothetical protein
MLQIFYPLSTVLVLFWGLSIDTSFENLMMFIAYALALNLTMVAQGYFCGCLTNND